MLRKPVWETHPLPRSFPLSQPPFEIVTVEGFLHVQQIRHGACGRESGGGGGVDWYIKTGDRWRVEHQSDH